MRWWCWCPAMWAREGLVMREKRLQKEGPNVARDLDAVKPKPVFSIILSKRYTSLRLRWPDRPDHQQDCDPYDGTSQRQARAPRRPEYPLLSGATQSSAGVAQCPGSLFRLHGRGDLPSVTSSERGAGAPARRPCPSTSSSRGKSCRLGRHCRLGSPRSSNASGTRGHAEECQLAESQPISRGEHWQLECIAELLGHGPGKRRWHRIPDLAKPVPLRRAESKPVRECVKACRLPYGYDSVMIWVDRPRSAETASVRRAASAQGAAHAFGMQPHEAADRLSLATLGGSESLDHVFTVDGAER